MDRTLFTSPMIETFRVCRRAYELAFVQRTEACENLATSAVCKRFILKALAEVNRGRITTVHQVQKFLGQHWPVDKVEQHECVKAFLFAYKTLVNYSAAPYRPAGARAVGVDLKVRARLPHDRVYLEDTLDLIYWYPKEKRLEFVDFHLNPLKTLNEAWPSPSLLVKQFLAERLRVRWPFEKLTLTFCRVSPEGLSTSSINPDEALMRAHWPDLLKTIEEMKSFESSPSPHLLPVCLCRRCAALARAAGAPHRDGSGAVREHSAPGAGPQVA
ncbi:MAG TPA: hypothetical protein V6D08_14520 [Candidatus Obscuribacterales bacterium]